MPFIIFAVLIFDFEKVFACKESIYLKLVIFPNDEFPRYGTSSFSLNEM